MNDEDQIYAAAKAFKQAIEKMGKKNVVLFYVFTEETPEGHDAVNSGFESTGYLQSLGALSYLKFRLLRREME